MGLCCLTRPEQRCYHLESVEADQECSKFRYGRSVQPSNAKIAAALRFIGASNALRERSARGVRSSKRDIVEMHEAELGLIVDYACGRPAVGIRSSGQRQIRCTSSWLRTAPS
jgi:hypothetical protein